MSLQCKPKTFVGALRDAYPPVAPVDLHLRGLMASAPCEAKLDISIFEPAYDRDCSQRSTHTDVVQASPTGLGPWRF